MFKKYPIEAVFRGPDPEVLHQLTDSAMKIARNSDKVYLQTTDWEPKIPVLTIDYNQAAARESGLSRKDIGTSLLAYTDGIPIGTFYDGIHPENIYVKCTDNDGNNIESLENANVFSMVPNISILLDESTMGKLMSGAMSKDEVIQAVMQSIPLKQAIKKIDIEWEDPVVLRFDGQRAQRMQCSPKPGFGTEEARQSIAKEIEKIPLPVGYSLSWEGEKKASNQAMKYLFNNFPLSIVLMIVILIMLFKDYKKPAIIFCCIPMILIGVIPSILISGKSFGFVAIVGVLGLIGMMIKNGLVLMDEINDEIEAGMNPRDALMNSSMKQNAPCDDGFADNNIGYDSAYQRCTVRSPCRHNHGWSVHGYSDYPDNNTCALLTVFQIKISQ